MILPGSTQVTKQSESSFTINPHRIGDADFLFGNGGGREERDRVRDGLNRSFDSAALRSDNMK